MVESPEIPIRDLSHRLNKVALGVTLGLVSGAGLMLLTFWVLIFSGGSEFLGGIGTIYFGYTVSIHGAFIGLLWGAVDGFILGYIIAVIYNRTSILFETKAARLRKTWAEKIDDAITPDVPEPEKTVEA